MVQKFRTNRSGFAVTSTNRIRYSCLNAVGSLSAEGCGGVTPLAESMCGAADALGSGSEPLILYVSSDGGENNSDGECAGTNANVKPYPPESWQGKVLTKLKATGTVNVR